jgi:signal transduction histidine kinase
MTDKTKMNKYDIINSINIHYYKKGVICSNIYKLSKEKLLTILIDNEIEYITKEQLKKDIINMNEGKSISLLAKYTSTDDQTKRDRHIERIKSSVKSLTEILNEFLSLGKIEEGKVEVRAEEFDLNDFVNAITNELNVILKPNQIIAHKHIGSPITYLDSNLLKHVIVNLLSNAIKFSPENSIISINTYIDNNTTTIEIIDQGIGIPKKDQIHLFERFFRATNVTNIQGTGLGLHIVGRYVELLNGHIKYESE